MATWSNWAGSVRSEARQVVAPDSEQALCAAVRRAAESGGRVRMPGSGHGWNAGAAPEDVWLRLDRLPRTVSVLPDGDGIDGDGIADAPTGRVRVAGHVRLRDLCAALEARGRMLPNLGTITEQTVAGALATGTHGTGASLGILSTGLRRLRLVDGRGEQRELVAGDPDLVDAAVHLGALGVITELELETRPAGRLHEQLRNLPLDAVLERLDDDLARHRHLRLWWLPRAGPVQVYTADPSDAPDTGPNALSLRLDRWGVQQPTFALLLWLGCRLPALVPAIHRFAQATSFPPRQRVEAARLVLTMPVPPRHDEIELAIDRARAADFLRAWWRLLEDAPYTPDFMQEVRFVAADDIALSPANGRDSVYMGAYCTNPATADRYFADMLALGREFDARPHWGKRFDHAADELAGLYPRWEDFRALRSRYDPGGVFRNTWLDRVLGPPA